MDFDFRGNIVDLLPDEFGYGFGTIFSQHDCFIRYGCGNKTSFTGKIISRIYQKEWRLDMNPIKVLEWKGMQWNCEQCKEKKYDSD